MNNVLCLEEILHRCAVLRCVATLQHRTLHEFDWFISACIWGKDGSYGEEGKEVYRKYSNISLKSTTEYVCSKYLSSRASPYYQRYTVH